MIKQDPLYLKLYFDPVFTEVTQLIGYAGCTYRELWDKLKPATEKYGQARTEQASAHILTFEGQFTCNPKPLAQVTLRAEVRKLAFQLLGPSTDHPEYERFQKTGCGIVVPPPKPVVAPPAEPKKKRTRKKAG